MGNIISVRKKNTVYIESDMYLRYYYVKKSEENNMLVRFEVSNFKNFKEKIVLDLSNVKGYEFNKHLIENDTVRCGVVFGKNASGKSNLAFAILDIVNHLTDKKKTSESVLPYRNLDSQELIVKFNYVFEFNGMKLEYIYSKIAPEEMYYEKLLIDNQCYIEFDYSKMEGFCKLVGTENLNMNLEGNKLSFVKYINNNSILERNDINETFKEFIAFVDNILLFYSLENNRYFGFTTGTDSLADAIVRKEKLSDFENFLNRLEIKCRLFSREVNGKYEIFNKFENGEANFFTTVSTGTKALTLFYYWLINASEASFIVMDEFDAYYHFELSEEIVKEIIKQTKGQIIFTSHNTNLMDTDLFRPDCLYIVQKLGIKAMCDLTDKELRKAHNLQKMYKAGAFDE